MNALFEQWLDEQLSARVARFLIDQRQLAVSGPDEAVVGEPAPPGNGASASDNFLMEQFAVPTNSRNGS